MVVLSAAAAKCVSTTAWLLRLPWLQLSGTMQPMRVLQAGCLHRVVTWSAGTVMCAATRGAPHLILKSATWELSAVQCKRQDESQAPNLCRMPASSLGKVRSPAQRSSGKLSKCHNHKHILWLCSKCPAGQQHSWSARPYDRTGAEESHCPCCARRNACGCNSLQVLSPEIAAE